MFEAPLVLAEPAVVVVGGRVVGQGVERVAVGVVAEGLLSWVTAS